MTTTAELRFDNWTLRGQPRELLRDGVRIRLQEQPLQILEELLAHPGQVVTREHLIAVLWPKRIVDYDTALNAAMRRLRTALGDEAETPRYIETIPRHGYRFMGTVLCVQAPEVPEADAAPSSVKPSTSRFKPVWVAVAAIAILASLGAIAWSLRHQAPSVGRPAAPQRAVPSIVVLPFVDLSAQQDQQYFSDGLTEELISQLAAELPLRVIARTSSFSFKGENPDIATVAEKLGVSHVLEGSVRKSGNRIRITAQLIDASTSGHIWSKNYDREFDDVLNVQDEIAKAVATALQVALSDARRTSAPPNDVRVYENLFRARFFFQRRAPGDLDRARANFEGAIALDPDFAPAWAGLAGVHWISMATGDVSVEEGREKVREAAERALQLDPNLAEAHLRMANYLAISGDERAADEHRRKAMAAEPHNPLVISFAASAAAEDDRFDEAIELQRHALDADPLSAFRRESLAGLLYLAGRFDEATAEWLKVRELSPAQLSADYGLALIQTGRLNEALAFIDTLPAGETRTQGLALVYHAMGRRAEADAALKELIATAAARFLIAEVCAYRGDTEAAFKWLAADDQDAPRRKGFATPHWVKRNSPFLEPLHSDERWSAWAAPRR
jgi:TolB-like protein/DNA-binding winged helix-turn-helix (wHTH) protein/Tfp pilus assembly protein PilF